MNPLTCKGFSVVEKTLPESEDEQNLKCDCVVKNVKQFLDNAISTTTSTVLPKETDNIPVEIPINIIDTEKIKSTTKISPLNTFQKSSLSKRVKHSINENRYGKT